MEPAVNFQKMEAVILCGGRGTRLGDRTRDLPKPMMPVAGEPFLKILIDFLHPFSFRRVILCTGYKDASIRQYFENYRGMPVVFSHESGPLGTGGALKQCESLVESSPFLVMNGDSFCRIDLPAFLDFHRQRNSAVSVAGVDPGPRRDGGLLLTGKDGSILAFGEKEASLDGVLNAGVYFFERRMLDALPENRFYSLEKDFFPGLCAKEKFYAWHSPEKLYDIGTPERLDEFRKLQASLSL